VIALLARGAGLLLLSAALMRPAAPAPATHSARRQYARADAAVREFRMDDLAALVPTLPPGPERDYFAGILANRSNQLVPSLRLLESALPALRGSQPKRAALALLTIADDDTKSFRYADAARAYDDLLAHSAKQLGRDRRQDAKDDAGTIRLLKNVPAQTITWNGPVQLQTRRNPLRHFEAELTVNGVRDWWVLDTGANLSVVTQSFARRLGLQPLPGRAQTMAGVTGIENPLQVAVLPTLRLGGATLHNVVFLILSDDSLRIGIGKDRYPIHAILGYPVLQALGAITFAQNGTDTGTFTAGAPAQQTGAATRMYMNLLMPVIECSVAGKPLPFSFDTGASGSNLSVRYYEQFQDQQDSWQKEDDMSSGVGGLVRRTIYLQPKLTLGVGSQTVTLTRVPIFPSPMDADIDSLYGNLGQDFVAGYQSFTLDFSTMTFRLGPPLPPAAKHPQ
jgi:Aspartyl protease